MAPSPSRTALPSCPGRSSTNLFHGRIPNGRGMSRPPPLRAVQPRSTRGLAEIASGTCDGARTFVRYTYSAPMNAVVALPGSAVSRSIVEAARNMHRRGGGSIGSARRRRAPLASPSAKPHSYGVSSVRVRHCLAPTQEKGRTVQATTLATIDRRRNAAANLSRDRVPECRLPRVGEGVYSSPVVTSAQIA